MDDAAGFTISDPPLHTRETDAETVARLAALTRGDYDRLRAEEAAKLGWRVETLDGEVYQARRTARAAEEASEADRPPAYSDEALALRFTDRHKDALRYVAKWGRWLIWTGSVWRFDETLEAYNLARVIVREAAAECNDVRVASAIASAKTVAAIERLAKADRRHAADHEQWDADPWLLNTPGGVVDLRTGEMRPHRVGDYMTKITTTAPGADCPIWLRFIERITGGDIELLAFLRRALGYCLTGSTKAHALFFGFGTGGNGKGVLLNTITSIMGAYAVTAQMETFTVSQGERHPADLAMLRGARLVTAQETEEGRPWAESRIKAVTGGDPITARFMRQDFFTFVPAFKLFIAGNHKPALRNVDEAIRRRMHLIPFLVTISAEERDPDLPEKLRDEWPGILGWMIDGCLEWQTEGLAAPYAVVSATDDYLEGEDSLAAWIGERCRVGAFRGPTASSILFADWRAWCARAGEEAGSQKRFSQALESRGYSKSKSDGRMSFKDIALNIKPASTEPQHDRE